MIEINSEDEKIKYLDEHMDECVFAYKTTTVNPLDDNYLIIYKDGRIDTNLDNARCISSEEANEIKVIDLLNEVIKQHKDDIDNLPERISNPDMMGGCGNALYIDGKTVKGSNLYNHHIEDDIMEQLALGKEKIEASSDEEVSKIACLIFDVFKHVLNKCFTK